MGDVRSLFACVALSALAALTLLSGCAGFSKEPGLLEVVTGPPAVTLTVTTFNIRYGTAADGEDAWALRRAALIDVIRSQDPDILALQEALRFQLDELLEALPEYAMTGVGRDDGKSAGEHAAILYRTSRFRPVDGGAFWLSDTPQVPGSRSWGNRVTRLCTWVRLRAIPSARVIDVYNTHLDHESQPSRQRAVELIADRIAARPDRTAPVILAGDFNVGEDNPAIRFLKGEIPAASPERAATITTLQASLWPGLRCAFRAANPSAVDVGTFNAFKDERRGPMIDYIFVDPAFEVRSAQIDRARRNGRSASDHDPVTARLRLAR